MKSHPPSVILAACLLTLALPAGASLHGEKSPRDQVLTVSAQASERIAATVADIHLAVEERAASPEDARARMARRTGPLLEYLRSQPVERLETSSLRIQPIYEYARNRREITGYEAVTTIRFRVSAELAGSLIDQSMEKGANRIQDLRFSATDEAREEARRKALRDAARLARERGETVLDELGLTTGRVIRIQVGTEGEGPVFPVRQYDMMRAAVAESAATEVEAGEEEITARVTLEISYLSD